MRGSGPGTAGSGIQVPFGPSQVQVSPNGGPPAGVAGTPPKRAGREVELPSANPNKTLAGGDTGGSSCVQSIPFQVQVSRWPTPSDPNPPNRTTLLVAASNAIPACWRA